MALFVVMASNGKEWDDTRSIRDQDDWRSHATFMESLVDEGFVLVGGPLVGTGRGLLIVEAPDEAAVRARLAEDPFARSGLMVVDDVHEWSVRLGSRPGTA